MSLFDNLPNEVILEIMTLLPDLLSLRALIEAMPTAFRIFQTYAADVFESVLQSSFHPEAQATIRTVALIRSNALSCPTFEAFKTMYLGNIITDPTTIPRLLPSDTPSELVSGLLASAAHIWKLTHACLHHYLTRTRALTPSHPINARFRYRHAYPPRKQRPQCVRYTTQNSGPPTWKEQQRAVRAFWRVQMFYDLQHTRGLGVLGWPSEDLKRLEAMNAVELFGCMDIEPEEMKTIVEYIHESSGIDSPYSDQLPRGLHHPTHHLPPLPSGYKELWISPAPLPQQRIQQLMEIHLASSACRFVRGRLSSSPLSPLRYVTFDPFRSFGFAIWDQERMRGLGLINSLGQSTLVSDGVRPCFTWAIWRSILSEETLVVVDKRAEVQEVLARSFPFTYAEGI